MVFHEALSLELYDNFAGATLTGGVTVVLPDGTEIPFGCVHCSFTLCSIVCIAARRFSGSLGDGVVNLSAFVDPEYALELEIGSVVVSIRSVSAKIRWTLPPKGTSFNSTNCTLALHLSSTC